MLKQRVLTAIVFAPLVLAAILFAPLRLFDLVIAAALVALALEYGALCRMTVAASWIFAAAACLLFALAVVPWPFMDTAATGLLFGAVALWLLAPLWLLSLRVLPDALKGIAGLVLLAGFGVAAHQLKLVEMDGRWLLMAFLLVWAADIGAYIAGRLFGRHKLAPRISPGKTWEGLIGGALLVVLIGGVAAHWLLGLQNGLMWNVFLLVLAALSVVGDLTESLLKRQAGVKDSGRLLPGHGGLLDRLDSLLAVAPVFLLAGMEIGIFGELSLLSR